MSRRQALIAFLTALASRQVVQAQPDRKADGSLSITDWTQMNKHLTYVFAAETLTIRIDGREAKLTAKEIADALGAK